MRDADANGNAQWRRRWLCAMLVPMAKRVYMMRTMAMAVAMAMHDGDGDADADGDVDAADDHGDARWRLR